MASSGKKAKKNKGKTIPLTDFLADGTTGPGPGKVLVHCSRTWAEEVENDDECYYSSARSKLPVILPTAPRESRSCRKIDDENIPRSPPYKAYIVNLHYDTNEHDIADLFENLKIVDVQLPRDDRAGGRLKGFGYIEFETREDLIDALAMDDTSIKGRRMRIEVSLNNDAGAPGGGAGNNNERRGGRYENREYDPERTQGDWRSGPRVEPPPTNKPSFSGGRNNPGGVAKDRGAFTRTNMDGPLTRDTGSFTRDNMEQGPYNAADTARETRSFSRDNMNQTVRGRDQSNGAVNRDYRGSGNEGRFDNRGRYNRDVNNNMSHRGANYGNAYDERDRGFGNRGDRNGGHYNNEDRGHNRYNDRRNTPEADAASTEVKTRPKLCLAQRTVAKSEDLPTVSGQSGIFGGARPVNTAAREKEIEDNRMRQTRESRNVRWVKNEAGNEGDGTFTKNSEGKSLESVDQSVGVEDEVVSIEGEGKDECCKETPESLETMDSEEERRYENMSETVEKEVETVEQAQRSSIFGGATPVDTAAREREVEERLAKSAEKMAAGPNKPSKEVEALVMQHLQKPPARSTIFGGATPVDTSAREREVEERLAREREEKRSTTREKRGVAKTYGACADTKQPPPPAEASEVVRDREVDTTTKHGHADTRRKAVYEQSAKKEERRQQKQQQHEVKKYEVARPPVENVWVRRAAQHAANQERGQQQQVSPPVTSRTPRESENDAF